MAVPEVGVHPEEVAAEEEEAASWLQEEVVAVEPGIQNLATVEEAGDLRVDLG